MVEAYFAEVAVEGLVYHFDAPYSYKIPVELETSAKPGCRVTVPFGNGNKKKQGLILSVKPLIEAENSGKLKFISSVLDSLPLFSDEMLELVVWLKDNTFCTLFEAAKAMLPAGIGLNFVVSYMANSISKTQISKLKDDELQIFNYLKDGCSFVKREKLLKDLDLPEFSKVPDKMVRDGVLITNVDAKRKTGDLTVKNVRIAVSDEDAEKALSTLTAKQKSVFKLLTDIGSASVKEVCYFTGVTQAVVMALNKKGLVEFYDSEVYRKPKFDKTNEKLPSPTLTDVQNNAYKQLLSQYKSGKGSAALLFGVTGSGKTQVFLKLIEQVVNDGKGVIVMVPEIALTPQTLGIFYSHFGETVAVFHSALSAGERIDEWKRVKNGEAKIAIGTRSAVFAPFDDLGLIVIDEEQEHTYKSEMSPRFHARDVARFRCAYNNALLLLSSATPSIETYKNALEGRYSYIKLDKRYGKAVLPDVVTVDISNTVGAISNELYNALEECLNSKKQAILLMNRRGFNTFASCGACKTVLTCPNCSISLTYHSANNRLMCHYCGYSVGATDVCPECGEKAVKFSGFGTQRIEDEIEKIFPNARVLRMDADTTMARYSYQEKLTAFAKGEYDILLGTQMVAKGLDFPNVTLVGIISIDHQLYNDDFRSSEKAFDLLTQVIGRSGRGDYKGTAYIQTILPDNDIIELSANQDYESFYNTESIIRKSMVYPPYCDICQLTFTSEQYNWSYHSAKAFFDMLKTAVTNEYSDVKVNLLGPIQPKIAKINNKYRNIITIKCKNNKRFRSMMSDVLISFMKNTKLPKTTVSVDINPLS
ncbi:MAG: primosomal protein N' [Oscillospiraceae bacterium]|nr:primosomal protein N' [Oscillospiraceae bacterium]